MLFILRLVAFLSFIASCVTLVRPRTGWGRLILFIPKLFSGSLVIPIGIVGLIAAVFGWLIAKDTFSLFLGAVAAIISFRHIFRIVQRSLNVGRSLARSWSSQYRDASKSMLPFPWIVIWKESPDASWQKDVQISQHVETGESILADIWHPRNRVNHSGLGIIFLHGSGWHYADKDFGTRHFFRHLAGQGHVIADVAYTLSPEADLFGMVADVKRAIAWMKNSAHDLGIRANHIILMGGSAGGHLALLAAYTPNHPKLDPADVSGDTSVHGVVSYYGPPDLRAQFDRFNELPGLTGKTRLERMFMTYLEARFGFKPLPVHRLLPEFLGGDPSAVPELYDLGSPSKHIGKHCPPTLLLQGMHDFSGVAPEVQHFHNSLLGAGCSSFLLELPDTEHGFDLYRPELSPAAQAATYVTERFLASLV